MDHQSVADLPPLCLPSKFPICPYTECCLSGAASKYVWIYIMQDSSHLYLVMDFHPGGDLLSVMERNEGGMSESDTRFIR